MDDFDNLSDGRKSLVMRSRARSRATVTVNPGLRTERTEMLYVESATFENDLGRWAFQRIPECPPTPKPPYRGK